MNKKSGTAGNSEVNVLRLTLHGELVGYLSGSGDGHNVLVIADEFKDNPDRPTLSLVTHPGFPRADKVMAAPWTRNQRLHPVLSNLLPEGSLRELYARRLKVHANNEFHILAYLGEDLPGAITARPVEPGDVPDFVLSAHSSRDGIKARAVELDEASLENRFSLAGVQMKFSMKEKEGRYYLSKSLSKSDLPDMSGDWIVKTPSTIHKFVPLNEYTAMKLAGLAGVEIPEIRLVDMDKLDTPPPINLPDEQQAFAIKRFDRAEGRRVHMEDFAQILVKYPHEKYTSASYATIGKIIHDYSGDGLADARQFARRLLVNILLANGDAHLKNWSLLYPDQVTPRLSPAYDIVTTRVYMEDETKYALNLGKNKDWYRASMAHFEHWANHSGIPWRAIKPHLADTMTQAREQWPAALDGLPMYDEHKQGLRDHWQRLHDDFRIETAG